MRIRPIEKKWFDLKEEYGEGSILIKNISPGDMQEIVDSTMDTYLQEIDGKNAVVSNVKNVKRQEKIAASVIVDWKDFYDENDNLMPCTDENKTRCVREMPGFIDILDKKRRELAIIVREKQEDQKKT